MLARYTIYRGKRPAADPLPAGMRQDIRAHTSHCLRASRDEVYEYLADQTEAAWKRLATSYRKTLAERYVSDCSPFDALAKLATTDDVYLDCSCPTRKNPRVDRCHTVLAQRFMESRCRGLDVLLP